MTLGEKIKQERKKKRFTQADLAGDKITRNMISLIEKDSANPSIETLRYIAERLELPLSYLISDTDDAFFYAKKETFSGIRSAYMARNFAVTISKIEKLEKTDDELSFILADCHLELGKKTMLGGSLFSAPKHFKKAIKYSSETCYNTDRIEALAKMYLSAAENIQSPLSSFDSEEFSDFVTRAFDLEFYNYLTLNFAYEYTNQVFSKHLAAKKLMKEKKYSEAITLLTEADTVLRMGEYDAYVVFGLYTDLEICCKELCDFEKAYKYSSKRFSLLEGFKN